MGMPSFNPDSKFLPKIGERNPAEQKAVMLKPVVMHGVSNEGIMVNVKEFDINCCGTLEMMYSEGIKLNRLTILAYKQEENGLWKLWTSGGFIFYADTDAFKGVKHEENKSVEVGESGARNIS